MVMQEYIITRGSIIKKCSTDGKLHLLFTETERPCREAYLKELRDTAGNLCSRYCIRLNERLNPPAKLGRLEEDVAGVRK